MRIVYRGNFGVDFSTESHVAASAEDAGHLVTRISEKDQGWDITRQAVAHSAAQGTTMFLWTQTYDYAHRWPALDAFDFLAWCKGEGIPTVGLHLDRWWGLDRQGQVETEPFFRVAHLFTADGDSEDLWAGAGVNHHWLAPAVFGRECYRGEPRPEWECDIAFIGSHQDYGHREWWPKRKAMLDHLRARHGDRFRCWPDPGKPAVRGADLNDLMVSAKIVMGDACFADRSTRYTSDRLFETVGRGGFLIMPRTPAYEDQLIDGLDLAWWEHGDYAALDALIDHYLAHDDLRAKIAAHGMETVKAGHTYRHRVDKIMALLMRNGAWRVFENRARDQVRALFEQA